MPLVTLIGVIAAECAILSPKHHYAAQCRRTPDLSSGLSAVGDMRTHIFGLTGAVWFSIMLMGIWTFLAVWNYPERSEWALLAGVSVGTAAILTAVSRYDTFVKNLPERTRNILPATKKEFPNV